MTKHWAWLLLYDQTLSMTLVVYSVGGGRVTDWLGRGGKSSPLNKREFLQMAEVESLFKEWKQDRILTLHVYLSNK